MNNHRFSLQFVVGFWLLLAPLAATAEEVPPATAVASHSYSYVLGPMDVIHIEALNHPDFNIQTTIGADGTVQLPYLGSVMAANMTVSSLRSRIADELGKKGVFSNFSLAIDIVSHASRYVTVLGGVVTPGLIPVDRAYHLSEILARAGGTRIGSSDYVVLRSPGNTERQLSIQDLATGDDSSDPFVAPGDEIFVPTEVFYIEGQVKAPGSYSLSLNMTLAMALARGGGLTDLGSNGRIKITRKNAELKPNDLNFKVLPDDVIDVGESWF